MNCDGRQEFFAIGGLMLIAMVFGLFIGAAACGKAWQVDSVKNGKAEYSQSTGEWQWKLDEKTKEQK